MASNQESIMAAPVAAEEAAKGTQGEPQAAKAKAGTKLDALSEEKQKMLKLTPDQIE